MLGRRIDAIRSSIDAPTGEVAAMRREEHRRLARTAATIAATLRDCPPDRDAD